MDLNKMIAVFRSKIFRSKLDYCMKNFGFASADKSTLLCVGCGNGSSMIAYLLPLLPNTITRIVGADTRIDLIELAKYKYKALSPRVTFQQMDLQNEDFIAIEKFDHLVSFWDTNWLQNVRVYLTNYLKCLRTNGTELLIFESKNNLFDAILTLSYRPEWKRYLNNLCQNMTPYQLGLNPALGSELICLQGRKLEYGSHVERGIIDSLDIGFHLLDSRIPDELKDDFYQKLFYELKRARNIRSDLIDIHITYTFAMLQK